MDLEIESLQPEILRIEIIFPAVSIFIVALRLYSRFLSRRFGWDDFLVIIALILAIAGSVASYGYTMTNWQGYHHYDIPLQTTSYKSTAGKYNLTNQTLYNPILVLVRSSIIAFILSLRHLPKAIKYNLYAINLINVAFFFSVLFPVIFQCYPFHYTFDKDAMDRAARIAAGAGPDGRLDGKLVFGGSCINRPAFYISTAIVSICLDLWLLVIPSALVWGINMPKRQKAVVITILSFWIVATIFGIIRLSFAAPSWLSPNLFDIQDSRYSITSSFHWIEVNLSIWTAAVPALKPMVTRCFPRWWQITPFEQGYSSHQLGVDLETGVPQPSPPPLGSLSGVGSRLEISPSGSPRRRNEWRYPRSPPPRRRPKSRAAPSYLHPGYLRRGITQSQIELNRFEHGEGQATIDSSYFNYTPEGGGSRRRVDESASSSAESSQSAALATFQAPGTPEDHGSPRVEWNDAPSSRTMRD